MQHATCTHAMGWQVWAHLLLLRVLHVHLCPYAHARMPWDGRCGLICCSFESSMFIFVFNWTPCLMEPDQPVPPFGHIFTGFMIFCLLGTRVYAYLSSTLAVEQIGLIIMLVSTGCHLTVYCFTNVQVSMQTWTPACTCLPAYTCPPACIPERAHARNTWMPRSASSHSSSSRRVSVSTSR